MVPEIVQQTVTTCDQTGVRDVVDVTSFFEMGACLEFGKDYTDARTALEKHGVPQGLLKDLDWAYEQEIHSWIPHLLVLLGEQGQGDTLAEKLEVARLLLEERKAPPEVWRMLLKYTIVDEKIRNLLV